MSSDSLRGLAQTLRNASDVLNQVATQLHHHDDLRAAFGVNGPGALGETAQNMYAQWNAALEARGREAAAHASRLLDVAARVDQAAGSYDEADESARRHQPTDNRPTDGGRP